MRAHSLLRSLSLSSFALLGFLIATQAHAGITFVSATGSASLATTIDEGDERIFVIGGIADGESTVLTFSTDTACPGVAMAGGAELTDTWSCDAGVITATVTNRGGMSFGPATDEQQGTFYVTFSDPPAQPGYEETVAALAGIQISVFGDVNRWDLDGEMSESGVTFGVELAGERGGEAHFRMKLPQAAVTLLGEVLGVSVGGKLDPFATVTTNDDGSVSLIVDIANLTSASVSSRTPGISASEITKKISTGERALGVAFKKTSVKSGKSVLMAMCAGREFTAGDKVPVQFTVAGKALPIKKSFTLDSKGCAQASVKLKSAKAGTLTAKVSYKRVRARATIQITR